MSTTTHPSETPNRSHPDTQRPAQCLRHHVWMAACADCRDARALPPQRAAAGRR